jgi:hypothetical protein
MGGSIGSSGNGSTRSPADEDGADTGESPRAVLTDDDLAAPDANASKNAAALASVLTAVFLTIAVVLLVMYCRQVRRQNAATGKRSRSTNAQSQQQEGKPRPVVSQPMHSFTSTMRAALGFGPQEQISVAESSVNPRMLIAMQVADDRRSSEQHGAGAQPTTELQYDQPADVLRNAGALRPLPAQDMPTYASPTDALADEISAVAQYAVVESTAFTSALDYQFTAATGDAAADVLMAGENDQLYEDFANPMYASTGATNTAVAPSLDAQYDVPADALATRGAHEDQQNVTNGNSQPYLYQNLAASSGGNRGNAIQHVEATHRSGPRIVQIYADNAFTAEPEEEEDEPVEYQNVDNAFTAEPEEEEEEEEPAEYQNVDNAFTAEPAEYQNVSDVVVEDHRNNATAKEQPHLYQNLEGTRRRPSDYEYQSMLGPAHTASLPGGVDGGHAAGGASPSAWHGKKIPSSARVLSAAAAAGTTTRTQDGYARIHSNPTSKPSHSDSGGSGAESATRYDQVRASLSVSGSVGTSTNDPTYGGDFSNALYAGVDGVLAPFTPDQTRSGNGNGNGAIYLTPNSGAVKKSTATAANPTANNAGLSSFGHAGIEPRQISSIAENAMLRKAKESAQIAYQVGPNPSYSSEATAYQTPVYATDGGGPSYASSVGLEAVQPAVHPHDYAAVAMALSQHQANAESTTSPFDEPEYSHYHEAVFADSSDDPHLSQQPPSPIQAAHDYTTIEVTDCVGQQVYADHHRYASISTLSGKHPVSLTPNHHTTSRAGGIANISETDYVPRSEMLNNQPMYDQPQLTPYQVPPSRKGKAKGKDKAKAKSPAKSVHLMSVNPTHPVGQIGDDYLDFC